MTAEHGSAGRQPGAANQDNADYAVDIAAIGRENQAIKPEVDLLTWAALGQSVKPSRADRRQKRGWKRDAK